MEALFVPGEKELVEVDLAEFERRYGWDVRACWMVEIERVSETPYEGVLFESLGEVLRTFTDSLEERLPPKKALREGIYQAVSLFQALAMAGKSVGFLQPRVVFPPDPKQFATLLQAVQALHLDADRARAEAIRAGQASSGRLVGRPPKALRRRVRDSTKSAGKSEGSDAVGFRE